MSTFSSSFDAETTATATEAALADDVKARWRRRAGQRGPTGSLTPLSPQRTEEVAPPHRHHSTNFYHSHGQIKINMILKSNLMLSSSISTST